MAGSFPSFENKLKSSLVLPFNLMHSGQLYYLDAWKVEDIISIVYGANQAYLLRFSCHLLAGVKLQRQILTKYIEETNLEMDGTNIK